MQRNFFPNSECCSAGILSACKALCDIAAGRLKARAPLSLSLILIFLLLTSFPCFSGNTYYVAPNGNDSNPGNQTQPWRTLQKAARTLRPGDTVLIKDGTYNGPVVHSTSGTATARITYKAAGTRAILNGSGSDRDAFYITEADYITVDGLRIQNATRAGIRVSLSNRVTIRNTTCANNGTWGIFTDYSDYLLIESNECFGSKEEHGIYVSNSGDSPVVRDNVVHDNNASGIQLNADPALPGDGIISHAVIERNIVYNNGAAGGAAINLASVRSSIVRNNLLYNNRAGGIAGWGDGNGPAWGCKNNKIANNTIYFANGQGRWCISLKEGSIGNIIKNNILRGGARGCYEYDDTSTTFVMDYNLLFRSGSTLIATNESTDTYFNLSQWRAKGFDANSRNQPPKFQSLTTANFLQLPSSPGLNSGTALTFVKTDLRGVTRPQSGRTDMGCYEQ